MNFTYTPAEEAFRQEFRAWLEPQYRRCPGDKKRVRHHLGSHVDHNRDDVWSGVPWMTTVVRSCRQPPRYG